MKLNDSKKNTYALTKKYILLFIIIFIGAILFFFEHFIEAPISIADIQIKKNFDEKKSSVGYLAPDFSLRNLKGNYESLDSYRGQVVVLNFWGTWCPPCRREIPLLVQLHKKYLNKGVKIIGIALDDPTAVKSYLEDNYVPYPVLWGSTKVTQLMKELGNEYGSLPFTVVVDSKGKKGSEVGK